MRDSRTTGVNQIGFEIGFGYVRGMLFGGLGEYVWNVAFGGRYDFWRFAFVRGVLFSEL